MIGVFQQKRLMASAGLVFFVYLIIHMLANLNFLTGEANFNGFYRWFNEAVILRWSMIVLIIASILTHIFIAISRQLDSNKKRSIDYKTAYPEAIPRWLAWSGASILLGFIVLHFVQVQTFETLDFYQEISDLFASKVMTFIYLLGLISLAAHLHHSLGNALQTFGLTHNQHLILVSIVVVILVGGFAAVPISTYF